jgi:GDP-L-fucose synthase
MVMNTNILNEALKARIPKFLSLLSTCIYPDDPVYPLTEEQIHNGKPHKSNYGYAYAKRMIEVQTRAIRQQYDLKYITAIPNNIYGENDNFDLDNSHVIPAIIRKIHESKSNNTVPKFWGNGSPIREFTYSADIARALLWMIEHYDDEKPLNIGSVNQYSISDIVEIIKSLMGVEAMNVVWDSSLPSGQYKKPSCNKKFLKINPSFKYTDIKLGLQKTIDWYNKTYPNIRGFNR